MKKRLITTIACLNVLAAIVLIAIPIAYGRIYTSSKEALVEKIQRDSNNIVIADPEQQVRFSKFMTFAIAEIEYWFASFSSLMRIVSGLTVLYVTLNAYILFRCRKLRS